MAQSSEQDISLLPPVPGFLACSEFTAVQQTAWKWNGLKLPGIFPTTIWRPEWANFQCVKGEWEKMKDVDSQIIVPGICYIKCPTHPRKQDGICSPEKCEIQKKNPFLSPCQVSELITNKRQNSKSCFPSTSEWPTPWSVPAASKEGNWIKLKFVIPQECKKTFLVLQLSSRALKHGINYIQ